MKSSLSKEQSLQEEEYQIPYHWFLRRNTRKGIVYFSYWERAIEVAGDISGKRLLDAGCGDGFFTALLCEENPLSVTGIDYSARAVGFAQILVPQATIKEGSIEAMPFENEAFDIVFLIETFEHIPLPQRASILAEISRVLISGGKMIVTVPSVLLPTAEKHEEHFTKESLTNILSPYFQQVSIVGQDKNGILRDIFWKIFSLWKNRFWTLHPLVNVWTGVLYRQFFDRAEPQSARRLIGVFRKNSQ